MPKSPQWMDLYQIWFRVSSRGRNQLCGILLQSAHGFRFCEGSKFLVENVIFGIADLDLLIHCNFYGATMMIKGSLLLSAPIVKHFQAKN